jgi:exodeoxyribonuclease-1
MLRHALFQNLYPAYLTSNHGNCRADALGLMLAASALSPTCLSVPVGLDGRRTFRLDQLASANGVDHTRAHDAMSDVLATLDLCRCVHERSSDLWQRFVRFSKKATVGDFVDAEDGFYLTEFFGNEAYHTPVVCVGKDPEQTNVRLCLRLDIDIARVVSMTDEELLAELVVRPSPVRRLRINAAPTLTAFYDAPDQMLNGVDLDSLEASARRIKGDAEFRARVVSFYVATREPRPHSVPVEGQLYEGFPGPADEARIADFHEASWPEALAIVQSLDDERLRTFGLRLIYFGARSVLPTDVRLNVERDLTDRLVSNDAGGLTLEQALRETETLLGGSEIDADGILTGYRTYLVTRIERVTEFRSKHFAI